MIQRRIFFMNEPNESPSLIYIIGHIYRINLLEYKNKIVIMKKYKIEPMHEKRENP